MEELYEAIMTGDVEEIQNTVDKQIKEAPSETVGKTRINNFKCDAKHLQDTGKIRYSNDVNGLNPLMFILWSHSIFSDSGEEISSDIIPMCKIFVEIHPNPNDLLLRWWGRVGNKYTPYSFVTDQLIKKEDRTTKEKNILENLLKYFDSKIDHSSPAALKKKNRSKKTKKKKNKSRSRRKRKSAKKKTKKRKSKKRRK